MFEHFKGSLHNNLARLLKSNPQLYVTDVNKDALWETYLASFDEPLRQENTCNCCKQFIRNWGNLAVIENGKMKTIWDFTSEEQFNDAAKNLNAKVMASQITDIFVTKNLKLGTNKSRQMMPDGTTMTWNHLFFELSKTYLTRSSASEESLMGATRDLVNVFHRSLEEITQDSLDTVLELISQNSLYRGAEFKGILTEFLKHKKDYTKLKSDKKLYAWIHAPSLSPAVSKIRGTSIGTLLNDLSEGKDLDIAVGAFERIMAPANYKRPTAIVTKRMIEDAEKLLVEMGLVESLGRRFATPDDIKVNNVLFVNRNFRPSLTTTLLGELKDDVKTIVNPKTLKKMEEISPQDFVEKILPNAETLEILLENRHTSNLVSVISPKVIGAPSLFKWNNPFSWSYYNAVADSMKEKVKAAGGAVDGALRVSLEWFNYDDLDLHLVEPTGAHIYYASRRSPDGGELDVDMNAGGGRSRTPVENIIYKDEMKLREGNYKVYVNQFNKRETVDVGFSAEIEFGGETFTFDYDKTVYGNITVAEFKYSKAKGVEFIQKLEGGTSKTVSKKVWNLDTNHFQKVSMVMKSPNFWDGQGVGNEHLFFIMDQAHNDEAPRGFFNEFLKEDLMKNKRVFEALASKMKVEPADKQLSGLGFSSTQRDHVIVKVTGTFTRTLKINF
jgi:hypothetical protein